MISLRISNVKHFMSELLVNSAFDNMLVSEISISTYSNFILDGHINKSYYSQEELDSLENQMLVPWKKLKSICYDLIKGKKLPLKMKIIFFLPDSEVNQILVKSEARIADKNIVGLCLNVKYENNILTCTTGTSLNIFTIDKSLENYFDNFVRKLLLSDFNAEEL